MSSQPETGTALGREFAPVATGRKTAFLCFAGGFAVLLVLVGWIGGSFIWPGTIRYEVTTEYLVVTTGKNRLSDETKVPLSRIFESSQTVLRGRTLHFGKEKPGFCAGYFQLPALGEVFLATDCGERGVIIRAGGLTTALVVSPAEPEKFIFAVRNHQPGVFAPPPRRFRTYAGWLALDLTVLGAGGGVLLWLFVIGPARLRYRVRPGVLEVGKLGRPLVVPLAGTRVRRHRPLQGERQTGVSLPAYVVGTFLLDSAATTVVASARDEGILLEGEGRFFFTPSDIDGMLAALGEAGAEVVVTRLQRRI
ncbi:MAG TPA: PH domain-containing protein [Thermoanaerobaculaceae bacterium]|nr:PH domain-containing protein [Thermoanaerobaculaceae bacterium]HRS17591.1 PH domain-containing protein [Thermoanaerobaculaceae bacterium]